MAEQCLLSVIVPVYNTADYLPSCLDSIIAQSWKNIEIIIVDDCSPDNAPEIADSYARRYPFIQVIHNKENKGLVCTRIIGMSAMKGEYFAFVDSDDSITVDYYRLLMEKAIANDADIVIGDYLEVTNATTYLNWNGFLQQNDVELRGKDILKNYCLQNGPDWWIWHFIWNKIFHRHLFDDTASFLNQVTKHIVVSEDDFFLTLFYTNAYHLVTSHGEAYCYYRREKSTTVQAIQTSTSLVSACLDMNASFKLMKEYLALFQMPPYVSLGLHIREDYSLRRMFDKSKKMKFSRSEKETIEKIFKNSGVYDKKDNPQEYFYPCTPIPVDFIASSTMKNAIADDNHKTIEFNIFGTLLLFPFLKRTDLFLLMEPFVQNLQETLHPIDFVTIRSQAEAIADRKRKEAGNQGKASLEETYKEVGALWSPLQKHQSTLVAKEKELLLQLCYQRKKGKELVDFALAEGKHIIYACDARLDEHTVTELLEKCGYPCADHIAKQISPDESDGTSTLFIGPRNIVCGYSKKDGKQLLFPDTDDSCKEQECYSDYFKKLPTNGNGKDIFQWADLENPILNRSIVPCEKFYLQSAFFGISWGTEILNSL